MRQILPRLVAPLAMAMLTLVTASADPYADLQLSEKKFFALRSWHADLTTAGQTLSMDFVAPNRFRELMPQGMSMVLIGQSGWMQIAGQTHPLPASMMGMFNARVQTIRTLGLQGDLAKNFTITYTGAQGVNGVSARTYHLVKKRDSGYTIDWWIASKTNLPLESLVKDHGRTITIVYSAFNAPISISGP